MSDAAALRRQQTATMVPILIATPVAVGLWLAVYWLSPPPSGMEEAAARLVFAVKCVAVATLFTLALGVEAVAHERLRSPAIDPLAGNETARLRVNQRYLQNTLEQLAMFASGLLGLAVYCPDGTPMRTVVATAVVWTTTRIAFWLGYHRGAALRAWGAPGMLLNLLVLLYVSGRFGYEVGGAVGAAVPLALFALAEAALFWGTRPVS